MMMGYVKTAIYVSHLENGDSLIQYGSCVDLSKCTKFWSFDRTFTIPSRGTERVSNFDIWKISHIGRGVSFMDDANQSPK
jgi:hypothetical protein